MELSRLLRPIHTCYAASPRIQNKILKQIQAQAFSLNPNPSIPGLSAMQGQRHAREG